MKLKNTNNAFVFVVSGASGSGKTTLCRKMAQKFNLYYSISHTTRPKRNQEVDGQDYYFIQQDEFKRMIERDAFLEWAEVYGNFYGSSLEKIRECLTHGQSVILDVDTQGAAHIKKVLPDAILVFIDVPSLEELQQRLISRDTDSEQEIKKRIAYAKNEISKKDTYNYVIINSNLKKAEDDFSRIIQTAQKNI